MDQDIGSSVIMRFSEHPRIICVGAEADDCKLSGYIHTYINGHTGGTIILLGKSINTTSIIKIALFLQFGYMLLEQNILRALTLYQAGTL